MKFFKAILDFFFMEVFSKLLYYYERHFFFRIRKAYGAAMVKLIKHKGHNLKIHGRCTIIYPHLLKVGNNVRIGNNCYFHCLGNIEIGNNVQFSRNITIYACSHNYESTAIPYDTSYAEKKSVIIEDNVWIGMGASILPGVCIAEGAIIGMNAVITKDVGKCEIVVGPSQRRVGYRDINHYEKLNKEQKWFGEMFPYA